MSELVAVPHAIRAYAGAEAAMATGIATAGAFDQAATIGAAVPVFGLIGQDFLMAFAFAQANHVTSVFELANVHAGTAMTAMESAAEYEGSEAIQSADFNAIGKTKA